MAYRNQMVAAATTPIHSEKFLEMSFLNRKLMRTVSQFGQGVPSAVETQRSPDNRER